jgi:hypothetical protein
MSSLGLPDFWTLEEVLEEVVEGVQTLDLIPEEE